jgi:8-oxo-dGTP diphosphatase
MCLVQDDEALELPMQPWFKRRLPLFFEKGTFEISVVWDEDSKSSIEDKLRLLG